MRLPASPGRAVARNIFLEGNSFTDSPSVDPRRLVAEVNLGFVLAWSRWRVVYTHVFRTEEFVGQGEGTRFGALSISYRW